MKWKLYVQNPENHDDQGVYVVPADEQIDDERAWAEVEFDGINAPGETGIVINDLKSGQQWARDIYYLKGEVVEVNIF